METDVYFSAAILGVLLALIFIIGWRRIVPVIVAGYIVGTSPAFAQYGDYDDDVPAINEVRDALLAQKQMLDNYFNGYTAPNKLNDISNALTGSHNGTSIADILWTPGYGKSWPSLTYDRIHQLVNTTGIMQSHLQSGLINSNGSTPFLSDISNYSEDSLSELQDLNNFFNSDAVIDHSGYSYDRLNRNANVQSLSELQNLNSNILNLDQDNDVPKLTEIATSSENAYLEMKNIREKMDAVYGDPVANNFPGVTSQQPVYAAATFETFEQQVNSKPSPTIGYDLENYNTGFETIPDSFNLSGFQDTQIPLLTGVSTPTIGGDLIGTINYKMGEHASFLSGIIKPLLTAWVCYLILSFTTRKTVDLIAA